MKYLSDDNQTDIIEAFNPTSRYLDHLSSIDNRILKVWLIKVYKPELQLNKANASDTEVPFLDLHITVSNGFA